MKTYAVHTDDYPRQTIESRDIWLPIVFAIGLFVFLMMVFSAGLLSNWQPVLSPLRSVIMSSAMASAFFSIAYYDVRERGYYIASVPIKGVAKVIFFIFTWVIWIPLLVSFVRMKLGEKKKASMDESTQQKLEAEARYYAMAKPGDRFPVDVKTMLIAHCRQQALRSKVEMTEDEALEIVEKALNDEHVLEIQTKSTINICIILKARMTQFDWRYDLGNYCLELLPNGQCEFYQVRSGRLANEMTIQTSADKELLAYFNECEPEIQRHLYTGRIDLAMEEIASILDVYYASYIANYMRQPYRMNEHYHMAADFPSSIFSNPPA